MIADFDNKCQHTMDGLEQELQKIRTGRAHAGLLDMVNVNAYGQMTALKQVASVSVQDARSLAVTAWDKGLLNAISRAIQESELGLNPSILADKIIVPMPSLTEERRKDLIKLVKQEGERCRVTLRHHRRDLLTTVKLLVKKKEFTEDDEKRLEQNVDKIIDKFSKQVEVIIAMKEKELLSV